MKITKSFLKQLIKEEMILLKKSSTLSEGLVDKYVEPKRKWANWMCGKIGKATTLRIARRVIDNPENWENIAREEYPENPEWLIEQIDDNTPANWIWTKALRKFLDKRQKDYIKSVSLPRELSC